MGKQDSTEEEREQVRTQLLRRSEKIDWKAECSLPETFEREIVEDEEKILSEMKEEQRVHPFDVPKLTLAQEELLFHNDVLLTGATGYFAPFLLKEIIDRYFEDKDGEEKSGRLFCLVRGEDEFEARERFKTNCSQYKL